VIATNGALGGYGSSIALKASLLTAEGLVVRHRRVADFRAKRWPS
jgi:hypothetical protein